MDQLSTVIALTLFAGLAMPLGACLARVEDIHPNWLDEEFRHAVMAFGGGALLSAVALVLVPDGVKELHPVGASLCFIAGGFSFMVLDIFLASHKTPASQLAAMLSDFVPESIALGAAFVLGGSNVLLLASLIAMQNLPEGFNAYRELADSSPYNRKKIILLFTLMAFLGPAAALLGYLFLAKYPVVVGAIMLFAAGAILYSVFQDIAPQAKLEKHWFPSMGAVLGFVLGMVGYMLTGF